MAIGGTKVVQVTNIAPQATRDQMQTLFGYLGKIDDIRLYPTLRDVSCPVQSRICYIKFMESATVGVAQHMTNTVFIDRALIVIPVPSGEIPDEYFALEMTRNGTIVPGLHSSEPTLPPNVLNTVVTLSSGPAIITYDPKLEASGLPPYPPLPSNYDTRKIEEIRRTVVMIDVDPSISSETYIDFFTPAGEVKYLRQCTRPSDNKIYMLVEFSDQPSIKEVLKMDGMELNGKPVQIMHSTQAIVKPQAKSNEAAQREIEEAMSRVKEAQNLISATIDPVIGMLSKDKRRRSRSRSRGRHRRSRSRSRSRRSRSRHRSRRSRSRSRKRSRSRDHKRRSKSRSRKRSRSRSRRSRSPVVKARKSRSKSRSKSTRRERSRYKSKDRAKSREKSKDKERVRSSRDREEKERSSRPSKDRDRSLEKSRAKSKDKDRDTRDSKERRSDKESTAEIEEKRSSRKVSRSRSRHKYRSRSRERKVSRSRDRRSRSRGRRRTPSPRRTSRKRSRSRSRDRKRDKRDKRDKRERTPSLPKTTRNYDEEERGYDERSRRKDYSDSYDTDNQRDKDSDAKSDNMDISNSP